MPPTGNTAPGFAKRPDYALDIVPSDGRIQALFEGEIIAETTAALTMEEANHEPVVYFPRADVRMDRLTRTDHDTFCPFKGHASYWTIEAGGKRAENAAWSYEEPYDEVAGIRDNIAFYADKVEINRL
jgi:uncharacterized protein (DUF427 family)